MSTPVPLLALALALCGLLLLVALIWHRRWLELAIVLLVGCAMALYFERGRRGPDQIGKLVAEVVNADRSISLHVQVEPGTTVWCSSVFSVEAAPAGEPARESADWFVDLHPTERSDAKPLNADAAGRAVVTLPARLVESAPNLAVRIRFNGNDKGTTRLTPHAESAESAEDESHAESAEDGSHAGGPDDGSHAEDAETLDVPFYYEWANPGTPEEMKRALEPVQRKIDGLDRLVSYECKVNPSGRADYTVSFLMKDDSMTDAREIYRILYEALDEVPVPDGAVLRVPVLVKGVKTPGQSPATDALPAQP